MDLNSLKSLYDDQVLLEKKLKAVRNAIKILEEIDIDSNSNLKFPYNESWTNKFLYYIWK